MYQSPTPVPMNVIWKVFIDVIKMRSYRIRMGPESLGKREIGTDTHTHTHIHARTQRRRPHGDGAEIRAM